jgi:hypothetical protein
MANKVEDDLRDDVAKVAAHKAAGVAWARGIAQPSFQHPRYAIPPCL